MLSAWITKVWMTTVRRSIQKSKNITNHFFSYEDISLKLYLDIVRTLDVKKLLRQGDASVEQCHKQWDEIIAKCSSTNGGLDYVGFIDMSQSYGILLSEYNIIKAWLTKLWFQVDDEIIKQLADKGYDIIISKDHPKYNPDLSISVNYSESILNAFHRCENLVTKIKMKANEIKVFMNGSEGGRKEMLFDETMAQLLVRGIKVEEDITLSRYMELLKILSKQTKEQNIYG